MYNVEFCGIYGWREMVLIVSARVMFRFRSIGWVLGQSFRQTICIHISCISNERLSAGYRGGGKEEQEEEEE